MRFNFLMFLFLSAMMLNAKTNEKTIVENVVSENAIKPDSVRINLNAVLVTKSMRENSLLNDLPVSYTALSGKQLEALDVSNLRSFSVYVPNLYVPDYGSKLTSAVYIRGIGSRLNTSAVGFYVDNIPYLDKSTFDFELQDIERVEVLRGPQGTLYGRNSMGGLIHIHTKSPFDEPESTIRLSYASFNDMKAEMAHSQIINPNLAYLVSVNYNKRDAFEKNIYTGKGSGDEESAGVRTKLAARFPSGWKADLSANYEYSIQNGYPYAPYSKTVSEVSYNDPSSYERHLFSAGLLLEKPSEKNVFSSMTGYQFLNDNLKLDQDFTPASIFTLNQKQKQNSITQEFVLKSNEVKPYEWVIGAFGFYRNMNTDTPVKFKQDGITSLLESNMSHPPLTVDITDNEFAIPSLFTEKNYSAALYHQSTYHFTMLEGLSVSAGLRLDYEHVQLDYVSSAAMNYQYSMTSRGLTINDALITNAKLNGVESKGFWQVVPKVSLQYDFNKHNHVYGSVSKGFQAGGYNIQIFSDLIQTELQAVMTQQMKQSIADGFKPYVAQGMPQSSVDKILAYIPTTENVKNVRKAISYDPEYSWNYELGFHSEPIADKLQIDGALFYIDCYNRQIAQFSPNGFGRMMKNASGSFNRGFEVSILAKPFKNLGLNASYGFTEAKFTDYKDSARVNGVYQEVDYSNNHVPMIPKHTLALGAEYTWNVQKTFLDKLIFGAQYTAVSSIYWTEKNDISQDFYGITNGQVSFLKGDIRFDLWVKNAFNQKYDSFYFESMGHSFTQQGKPRQVGLTAKWSF